MTTSQITTIKAGTRVSYEDMANPRCEGIVCDIETSRWGTQYVIAWSGHRAGEISYTDLRQNGWKLVELIDRDIWTDATFADEAAS